MIHQRIVTLEYINVIAEICSIQGFLNHLEVRPCINFGSPGNYLLVNVQVSTISRGDLGYLEVALDHIGQQGLPHTSHKLEVQHYILHSFGPIVLINFRHLGLVCLLLFQLSLMLVLQHRYPVDTYDLIVLGTMLHCVKHECHEFEFLCGQDRDLVPPVQSLHAH